MSMKPQKKSDSQKGWMKKRRDRYVIIAPEYHLIVTEGTKTEPLYFEGLKKDINQKFRDRIAINVKGVGQGANTLTLLDFAQKIVNADPDKYNHVWLVYDQDDFPKDDFDNTFFKCQELSKDDASVKYHALWSNECIEFWFLLHFMFLHTALHRSEYFPKLTKCLDSTYEKNRIDMYELLKPFQKKAIANAKRILEYHKGAPPSQCSPGTAVYEIFDMLKSYLMRP